METTFLWIKFKSTYIMDLVLFIGVAWQKEYSQTEIVMVKTNRKLYWIILKWLKSYILINWSYVMSWIMLKVQLIEIYFKNLCVLQVQRKYGENLIIWGASNMTLSYRILIEDRAGHWVTFMRYKNNIVHQQICPCECLDRKFNKYCFGNRIRIQLKRIF